MDGNGVNGELQQESHWIGLLVSVVSVVSVPLLVDER